MWRLRYKETKEPFDLTQRIGFAPRMLSAAQVDTAEAVAAIDAKAVPIPRRGGVLGKAAKVKPRQRKKRQARALDMPHGCRRSADRIADHKELKRQSGAYGDLDKQWDEKKGKYVKIYRAFVPKVLLTCIMCGGCGKYFLSYLSRGTMIGALMKSSEWTKLGMSFTDLELVNRHGNTMKYMVDLPIKAGCALRHKSEKWYWATAKNRVWYKRASDIEAAWTREEKVVRLQENRKKARTPRQAGLILVVGKADGTVEERPNWLQ